MQHLPPGDAIAGLLDQHRALEQCIRESDLSLPQVLAVGQTLLAFAQKEDRALAALLRLLDPEVVEELRAEHDEIGKDLELLQWLAATSPESQDAFVLAASLARRMYQHVSRDGRMLALAASLHLEVQE